MPPERIGILTGGGDCPGLNAVIRAAVRRSMIEKIPMLGIKNGWSGLVTGEVEPLTRYSVLGILHRGGTILGTSRLNPTLNEDHIALVKGNWHKFGLDSLIVVGGEGTLRAGLSLWRDYGFPIVGVPKTIDNDISGTDYTFGFDTAVSIVTEAIDRLHTTAESHHRVMVIEVMGRHTGWIAGYAGMAGGADIILVPEKPFRISEVCSILRQRRSMGRLFSIVVVAEDAHPHPEEDFLTPDERSDVYHRERLGGIGNVLAREIEKGTGIETRVTVLGYVQRGGSPTAFDRILASRLGVKAVEMILHGEFGQMAALQGTKIVSVPLEEATRELKRLDLEFLRTAEVFFG
ncbi:MAG TPA: ATP-dependent 6-phosphofructokinase [Blastocatellia bacterium]|nr:ATP-dependent 6-phosphofructokinase [Blastocatellia bacterium]